MDIKTYFTPWFDMFSTNTDGLYKCSNTWDMTIVSVFVYSYVSQLPFINRYDTFGFGSHKSMHVYSISGAFCWSRLKNMPEDPPTSKIEFDVQWSVTKFVNVT
jgi:hypothetical protein